jgi:ribonuclease-3
VADRRSLVAHSANGALSVPKRRDTALGNLADRIGYAFKDRSLLELALPHASARPQVKANDDNERLEFLGDRVLGLAVAELLIATFPDESEGDLARRYNQLVRSETCANVAQGWDLGKLIVMSGGEAESGGRAKKTILANACEALLGAIFTDGGYMPARDIVHRFWRPELGTIGDAADAKSVLQEWAQGRRLPLPRYSEIAREGPDHAPRFTAEVEIDGIEPERGQGANKRQAEQAAALAMLQREGVWQVTRDD